jgi:hypothetical protein
MGNRELRRNDKVMAVAPSPAGGGELPGRGSAGRPVAPERCSKMVQGTKTSKNTSYNIDVQRFNVKFAC